MTFDEWWARNGQRYYVSIPHPKIGWMVDVAQDAWDAACKDMAKGNAALRERLRDLERTTKP